MGFVANLIRFPAVQNFFENRLRFAKNTESLKVGTFMRTNERSLFANETRHFHNLRLSVWFIHHYIVLLDNVGTIKFQKMPNIVENVTCNAQCPIVALTTSLRSRIYFCQLIDELIYVLLIYKRKYESQQVSFDDTP